MLRITKLACFFVLLLSFAAPALALLPVLVATAAEIAAPAIISGGLTYLLGPTGGNIKSYGVADNYGIKRNMLGKVGPAAGVLVAGALAYGALRDAVNANPGLFPSLNGALNVRDLPEVGDVISVPSVGNRVVTLVQGPLTLLLPSSTSYYSAGSWYEVLDVLDSEHYLPNYYVRCLKLSTNPTALSPTFPSYSPRPDSELPSILNGPDGNVAPQYQPEVDAAMQGNPDSVTGLPHSSVAASGSAYSAGQAAAAASNAMAAQQSIYNANPTPENLAKLEELKAAEAAAYKAQSDAAQAEAEREAEAAEKAAEQEAADNATANLPTNSYDSSLDMPLLKSIPELLTSFFDNSPLLGVVRSFQISTADQQAVFNFGNFWGQDITVDFSRWSSVLAGCGAVLLILSHAYAVMIVVRG